MSWGSPREPGNRRSWELGAHGARSERFDRSLMLSQKYRGFLTEVTA